MLPPEHYQQVLSDRFEPARNWSGADDRQEFRRSATCPAHPRRQFTSGLRQPDFRARSQRKAPPESTAAEEGHPPRPQ